MDAGDSFALRLTNLRKLQAGFDSYLSLPLSDSLDLGDIARNPLSSELPKLLELVIYSVIRCSDKEKYISRILQLSQQCQGELMVFIETVLEKFERKRNALNAETDEIERVKRKNAELERDVENLTQELKEIRTRESDLRVQFDDLKSEIAKNTKKPDSYRLDLEGQLAEKTAFCLTISKKLEEMSKFHETEMTNLRDELDIANERLAQTVKLENALEMYKRKAEEGTVAKKKLKEIETFNKNLQEKLQAAEEERGTVTQLQHSLSIYKDQLSQEKERSASLNIRLQALESDLQTLQKDRLHSEERIQTYELKIRQLTSDLERSKNPDFSEDFPSLRSTFGTTELEEQLKSLENENKRLQLMIGNEELVKHFNEQIDEAIIAKKQVEERLKQALSDLNTSKSLIEDLQSRLNALESTLITTQTQLKDSESENTRNLIQEIERLKTEKVVKQLEIEKNNLILSVENSNLKLEIREKADLVALLQKKIEEMERSMRKSLDEQRNLLETERDGEMEQVKRKLGERERELEELTAACSEMKALWYKEEKLMVGVMHEIGVEVFRLRAPTDPSYLSMQREKAARP